MAHGRRGSSGGDDAYLGEGALGEDTDVKLAISINKNQKNCIARAVMRCRAGKRRPLEDGCLAFRGWR